MTKKKPEAGSAVSRRDTLKLATALSALGVGLGVTVNEREAHAETVKLDGASLGALSLKLYKDVGGKQELLHTLDLTAVTGAGRYAWKLTNLKNDKQQPIAEHVLEITPAKG